MLLPLQTHYTIHNTIHHAHASTTHSVLAIVKGVVHVSHHMPHYQCVVTLVGDWSRTYTYSQRASCGSWFLPRQLTVDGVNGAWTAHFECLEEIYRTFYIALHPSLPTSKSEQMCVCVCVCVWQSDNGV